MILHLPLVMLNHGQSRSVVSLARCRIVNADAVGLQIRVHRTRRLRVHGPCHSGLGWFRPFFSHPALIALVAVLFVLSILSFFAGGNLNAGVREDRGNRWVIPVFGVIGFLNAYLPAYTDRKELWTIDGDAIRWLGVALFAITRA